MNDMERRRTKTILDELLVGTEIKIHSLSESCLQVEMNLEQIREEIRRPERLVGDIESLLRGYDD